jgi:hypothetical protein
MIKSSSCSPGYVVVLKCAVSDSRIYSYICGACKQNAKMTKMKMIILFFIHRIQLNN